MAGNAQEWTSDFVILDRGEWQHGRAPGTVRFADPSVVDPGGPTRTAYLAAIQKVGATEILSDRVMRGGLADAAVGTRRPLPTLWDQADVPIGGIRCARSLPTTEPPPVAPDVTEALVEVSEAGVDGVTIRSSAL
jgi:hypothetical protein